MILFDHLCNALLTFLATYLIHSTLLLGCCWIVFRIIPPPRPILIDRIWKFVSIAGFMTAAIQLSLDGSSSLRLMLIEQPLTAESISRSEDSVPVVSDDEAASTRWTVHVFVSETSPTAESVKRRSMDAPQVNSLNQAIEATEIGTQGQLATTSNQAPWWLSSRSVRRLAALTLTVWIAASSILLFFHWYRFGQRMSRCQQVTDNRSLRILARLCGERHSIRLLSCSQTTEPVAFGILRPTILLPEQIESQLNDQQLRALLAHEVAHLVRGDAWWLLIGQVLCSCFAFQPLHRLARRRWQTASEFLCDQWAIEHGTAPLTLARCLTNVAAWRVNRLRSRWALSATGSGSTVIERVHRLTQKTYECHNWRATHHAAFLGSSCLIAAVLIVIAPSVGWSTSTLAAASPDSSQHSAHDIELSMLDTEMALLSEEIVLADKLLGEQSDPALISAAAGLKLQRERLIQHYQTLRTALPQESDR